MSAAQAPTVGSIELSMGSSQQAAGLSSARLKLTMVAQVGRITPVMTIEQFSSRR